MPRPAPRVAPATSATLPVSGSRQRIGRSMRGVGASRDRADDEHGRRASCAGEAERLAEDQEREHDGDERLERSTRIDAARRADALQAGEEEADAPTVETTAMPASQPQPAALTSPGSQVAERARRRASASTAAPVQTSALSATRADARGDALAS